MPKYLCFFVERLAGGQQCNGAAEKLSSKCIELRHSEQPFASANLVVELCLFLCLFSGRPPPMVVRFELSAIFQTLGLAGNSMTSEAAYRLPDFVGVSATRPSFVMEAAMTAAIKTSVGWEDVHLKLAQKKRECSKLSATSSIMIPPGWDCSAFRSNLYVAFSS